MKELYHFYDDEFVKTTLKLKGASILLRSKLVGK